MKHIILLSLLMAAAPLFGQTSGTVAMANPAGNATFEPSWSSIPGGVILTWAEKSKDGSYALQYATRKGDKWSEVHTVAAGRRLFRHPAEVPEVIQLPDGTLMAHWIETTQKDSDAEFAYVSASKDGIHWSTPIMAHKDHSPVEHGLASMIASGKDEASLIWLEALHGEDQPVAMKRTVLNSSGSIVKEEVLDPDVCGCCPTAIADTAKGLLIAYRAHTKADIRDIATIRYQGGKWSSSKIINPDGWKIDACPTNAASISANGDKVAVSWFTGAQDKPRTQIALSSDAGATFSKPMLVSTGHSFGYTSAVLDEAGGVYVSWLEQGPSGTRILVRHVGASGALGPVVQVAQGSRSSLGYPKLVRSGSETLVAWGSAAADSKVQTARVTK